MWQPPTHLESEEEYSHRHDVELIEQMHRRAQREERRRCLAEATHITDPRLLETLDNLGFDAATAPLLRLVPMLQVAWSLGGVSEVERKCILDAAAGLGVNQGSPAHAHLVAWLDTRPPGEFFERGLDAIRAASESLGPAERQACRDAVIRRCRDVASAGCGFWGWKGRICAAKRKLIWAIAEHLDTAPPTATPASPKG